jgi:hypothetical protein
VHRPVQWQGLPDVIAGIHLTGHVYSSKDFAGLPLTKPVAHQYGSPQKKLSVSGQNEWG